MTQGFRYQQQLLCALSFMSAVLCVPIAQAQVPRLIRYQGQAFDRKGVPLEGPYDLTFRLYDADTGGTKLWEERQAQVGLSQGQFDVLLGQVTPMATIAWSAPCWLSLQVGAEPELAPRQQITSVPLAVRAGTAEQLEGAIRTVGDKLGIATADPKTHLHVRGTSLGEHLITIDGTMDPRFADDLFYIGVQNLNNASDDWFYLGSQKYPYALTVMADTGNIGISEFAVNNILAVKRNSLTDPIADSWTVYPSDRAHKQILRANPSGYLDQIKATPIYEWTRRPLVTDEEAAGALGIAKPASQQLESKKQELAARKARLPKYTAKRVGMIIDDANVPAEILTFDADGTKTGIDLLAYLGYLQAALREAALKIDELESRLPPK